MHVAGEISFMLNLRVCVDEWLHDAAVNSVPVACKLLHPCILPRRRISKESRPPTSPCLKIKASGALVGKLAHQVLESDPEEFQHPETGGEQIPRFPNSMFLLQLLMSRSWILGHHQEAADRISGPSLWHPLQTAHALVAKFARSSKASRAVFWP